MNRNPKNDTVLPQTVQQRVHVADSDAIQHSRIWQGIIYIDNLARRRNGNKRFGHPILD